MEEVAKIIGRHIIAIAEIVRSSAIQSERQPFEKLGIEFFDQQYHASSVNQEHMWSDASCAIGNLCFGRTAFG